MDLPFYLTLTPLISESGQDGSLITFAACSEGTQFWYPTRGRFLLPCFEGGCIPPTNHLRKGLRQFNAIPGDTRKQAVFPRSIAF